ncbi:MAG: holo-ACP synthase [Treponema sp.]|nr:holo-ACP synthase [Treponema sp.]MDE6245669.1 holo-ACP synthase [Treponemataceae bacterium]MBD5410277.1 holo-ACP synthase [Treponema sp.]MBD5411508.1 holo-ACP synthase [Treponema sp.]MBD5442302.1 holo-ACP synthase [Treponema sp.]
MIFGIGVDIVEVKRFERWVNNPDLIDRYFNSAEKKSGLSVSALCQHYAVRFAAKEAFSKALGTGISGFLLSDVYVKSDERGKPELVICDSAKTLLDSTCGKCTVHISLSHEKGYAVAFVVIEKD